MVTSIGLIADTSHDSILVTHSIRKYHRCSTQSSCFSSRTVNPGLIYPVPSSFPSIKTRIQTEVTPPTTTTSLPTPTPSIHRINAPKSLTVAKGTGVRKMLMRIIKEQGLAGLYRGFGASMLNSFSMQL